MKLKGENGRSLRIAGVIKGITAIGNKADFHNNFWFLAFYLAKPDGTASKTALNLMEKTDYDSKHKYQFTPCSSHVT